VIILEQVDPELLKRIYGQGERNREGLLTLSSQVSGREIATARCAEFSKSPKDSRERQMVWESSKGVGKPWLPT